MNGLVEKAKKILTTNQFMVISSASQESAPWITPVYYAHDGSFTFYWYSGRQTKHSKLIAENNKIAIVVFNPHATESESGGVYLEGKASEVAVEELSNAMDVYFSKVFPQDNEQKQKMLQSSSDFQGDSVLRFYKFIPEKVFISGDARKWNGKWIDSRIEISLV